MWERIGPDLCDLTPERPRVPLRLFQKCSSLSKSNHLLQIRIGK